MRYKLEHNAVVSKIVDGYFAECMECGWRSNTETDKKSADSLASNHNRNGE